MDLDALRYGNFSKLGEAVTDWEQMTQKLAELKKDAQDNLKAKADKAKWAGVNATVSREFVDKTAAEFEDAHTQASSITKILSDTRSELMDCRTQLNDAIERGAKQNLTVVDTGRGTFTVTRNTRPDWASDPSGKTDAASQKAADDLRDEIQRILGRATESDNTAARVLNLLVDQAKYGFSDAKYEDRDSAAKAVAAAEKLAKIAKDPARMTLDDIAAFNRAMERYREDPLFSEQFARRLGPKDTLQFWTEMTYAHAGARGSELNTMTSLQKNLSMTLATASFSDSDAMRQWKKELLAESNTAFRPANQLSPIGPLGSQVISSLMRQGQYDTEFLDAYRRQLFEADKRAGTASNTDAIWVKGYEGVDLVFGDGNGRDPLEGLFEGLSHNPEAALHAFETKSDFDRMMETVRYTDRGSSLGHALEAAVTGAPAGDPTYAALPHSKAQVQIMANIMEAVAQPDGGADLVKQGMGESFGHMAASYMPEISRELQSTSAETVFLTNSEAPAGLKTVDVTRFLSAVALDPDGRAGIIYGESIYTGSLIEAHLSNPSLFDGTHEQVLENIGRNAGLIQGIVGHSVADAEISRAVGEENDYNESLKTQGDFFKTIVATGVGYGTVALAPSGPAGAAIAGGGGFLAGVAGIAIDNVLEGRQMENAEDEALYRTGHDLYKMRDSVNQQTQWSVQEAVQRHNLDLPKQSTDDIIRRAVIDGWDSSSEFLNNSKERPHG